MRAQPTDQTMQRRVRHILSSRIQSEKKLVQAFREVGDGYTEIFGLNQHGLPQPSVSPEKGLWNCPVHVSVPCISRPWSAVAPLVKCDCSEGKFALFDSVANVPVARLIFLL